LSITPDGAELAGTDRVRYLLANFKSVGYRCRFIFQHCRGHSSLESRVSRRYWLIFSDSSFRLWRRIPRTIISWQ